MWTKVRHYGFRIINICHDAKAVGTTARGNNKYVLISVHISPEETKKINEIFVERPI